MKKFPNKDTPLIVGCSNGTQYALDALEQLDEVGASVELLFCLVGVGVFGAGG